jgi:putative membrane protein
MNSRTERSRRASGVIIGVAFALPGWAASLATMGPAQPVPQPVFAQPIFDGATVTAPAAGPAGRVDALNAGSAALVPLMAADVAATQEISAVDASRPTTGGESGKLVDDLTFVARATESGRKEIESAREALPQLRDPELKRLAEVLVDHHGDANARLSRIAEEKGWPVPALHRGSHAPAAGTASADFDARWTAEMIAGHERSAALYRAQAQTGEDKDLRNYARETLPTIEQHLDWLRRLQK